MRNRGDFSCKHQTANIDNNDKKSEKLVVNTSEGSLIK